MKQEVMQDSIIDASHSIEMALKEGRKVTNNLPLGVLCVL